MAMAIYGKIISSLYDYINSEEFSTLILQEEPKLETFLKMKIDGIVHKRMERATKMWLDENVPKIVKTEFDLLIQDITDKYEEMSNICKSLEGISEPQFQYGIKEEGFFWTVALHGSVIIISGVFSLVHRQLQLFQHFGLFLHCL